MMNIVLIGAGGALGSILRYWTALAMGRNFPGSSFPFGTLTVNVAGCFIIAFIGALAVEKIHLDADLRLLLFTGILGGFTTFSAFGYETFYLLKTSQIVLAVLNISANLVLGLGAVILGHWIGRAV